MAKVWVSYVVSAHTADPLTNWKSFPKDGVSEDNLAPSAPAVTHHPHRVTLW
ncbi:MAG: hypothetical protein H6629_14405 [Calditrichae bacterium]|nr:hypothetical protein [Calditrichia bacterium]